MFMSRLARRAVAIPEGIQNTVFNGGRVVRLNPIGPEGRASRKGFRGGLKAVVLDWAGTVTDAHCIAPAACFKDTFAKWGIDITMQEAREPMGLRKDTHVKELMNMPRIKQLWIEKYGSAPTDADVQKVYADFKPMQVASLSKYSKLLPKVPETIKKIKEEYKMKVGTCTGYNREMVDVLLKDAKPQGYEPDYTVAGDDVPNDMGSRPGPFMIYQNLVHLGVYPIEAVVKVDDGSSGITEALNAGCWSVGVANYSNYTDVDSMEQWEAMPEDEKERRQEVSRQKLYKSGAHYVIDEIGDLPTVIEDINLRLGRGETPYGTIC